MNLVALHLLTFIHACVPSWRVICLGFERFFTTERDHGGTGLGLAIVRAVAEARGGHVDVDTDGHGSTFTLVV